MWKAHKISNTKSAFVSLFEQISQFYLWTNTRKSSISWGIFKKKKVFTLKKKILGSKHNSRRLKKRWTIIKISNLSLTNSINFIFKKVIGNRTFFFGLRSTSKQTSFEKKRCGRFREWKIGIEKQNKIILQELLIPSPP